MATFWPSPRRKRSAAFLQLNEHGTFFTYREQTLPFAAFFANGGLTLHDHVVYSQVAQTAALLGVAYEALDLPAAYAPGSSK